jgi:hypothetical protein
VSVTLQASAAADIDSMEIPDLFTARISRCFPLSKQILDRFLHQVSANISEDSEGASSVDISRELRGRSFKLIQLLLKNPLQELLSTEAPNLRSTIREKHVFAFTSFQMTGILLPNQKYI